MSVLRNRMNQGGCTVQEASKGWLGKLAVIGMLLCQFADFMVGNDGKPVSDMIIVLRVLFFTAFIFQLVGNFWPTNNRVLSLFSDFRVTVWNSILGRLIEALTALEDFMAKTPVYVRRVKSTLERWLRK